MDSKKYPLGNSSITLDLTNFPLSSNADRIKSSWEHLTARFDNEIGFYNAPISEELSSKSLSMNLAKSLRGRFKDCIFLGIGGSALGPESLLCAIPHLRKYQTRFHFLQNADPFDWSRAITGLSPDDTLVCTVTKSGTTFETLSLHLLALEWLGEERWKTNLVCITDPEKGDLRTFSRDHQIPSLPIHNSIGGRFSIFSPVGLFPCELAGLNTDLFVQGAREARRFFEETPPTENPVFHLANSLVQQEKTLPNHVCMPYLSSLKLLANWWVQLWGESLGKDGRGFTPISAVGATDQHSILQLLRDGPNSFVTFFINVTNLGLAVKIPKISSLNPRLQAFHRLEQKGLADLLTIEYQATSRVLTNQNRANLTLELKSLDEHSIGALYFTLCVLTGITGALMNVNPFDQPGVEEGKVYIKEGLANSR